MAILLGSTCHNQESPLIIVDGRRLFDPETAEKLGIIDRGVGAENG
jgi:hypothetical protein